MENGSDQTHFLSCQDFKWLRTLYQFHQVFLIFFSPTCAIIIHTLGFGELRIVLFNYTLQVTVGIKMHIELNLHSCFFLSETLRLSLCLTFDL